MLSRLKEKIDKQLRRGFTISDLILGIIGNPRLALQAARHILRRKARIVESGIRATQSRPALATASNLPLDRATLIEGLAAQMGILLLEDTPKRASLGLAEVNLLSALLWLNTHAQGVLMRIGKAQINFGTRNVKSRLLAAQTVELSFQTSKGDIDTLEIEAYFRNDRARWVSPNPANRTLRAIYDDRLETPGLYRANDILGGVTLADRSARQPVDVVYTWVNHDDKDWAQMYAHYKAIAAGAEPGVDSGAMPQSADAMAMSRFHSNDELRYSLRSVATNLPWIRQIYVFTNCAPPDWLKVDHPNICWVHHEDVIPADFLPTFSSHVIESFLHRLPGIAERFIYINDDVFVGKPLDLEFFFDASGASRSLLEPYGMVSGVVVPGDPDYLNASRNSAALINEAFGFVPTQLHRHTTFALRRDLLEAIEARWPTQLHTLRRNRFRTAQDLNLTSFLYHHFGLANGQAVIAPVKNAFIKSTDIRWKTQLEGVNKLNPDIICINEGGDSAPSHDWHASVRAFLHRTWPQAAPWER